LIVTIRFLAFGMAMSMAAGCASLPGQRLDPNMTPEQGRARIESYLATNGQNWIVVSMINPSGLSNFEYVIWWPKTEEQLCGMATEERTNGQLGAAGWMPASPIKPICIDYMRIAAVRTTKNTGADGTNSAMAGVLYVMALPFAAPIAVIGKGGVGQ
jgi:hypothetical protein